MWKSAGRAPSLRVFTLAFALQLRKKHGKTTVRVRETLVRLIRTSVRVQYTYYQETHTLQTLFVITQNSAVLFHLKQIDGHKLDAYCMYVCKAGPQTVDHMIYECNMIKTETAALITNIFPGEWPMEKRELLKKHTKHFTRFIHSIDFEAINSDTNSD
jgi:hypothetical protein